MGDMKLLSQTMDMSLMVPPWIRIPTSWINTHTFSLAGLVKTVLHVNAPILHQALAKYLDKHITRQDSCDGEEHIFFYSIKQSLQASKDLDQLQNKDYLFLQVEFAQLYMKCLLLEQTQKK